MSDRDAPPVTDRARVRRKADRGRYDWPTITAVLDAGLVAHVGCAGDAGVVVLPMAYGRIGRDLYLHGATANHLLHTLVGRDLCITVTLVDGLVLARSAFHHAMNYRSVVVFGRGERVDDPQTKRRALLAVIDHVVPGRAEDARPPSDSELRSTLVVRVPLVEASAKVRTGPPIEEPDDLGLPVWAGEVPLRTVREQPVPHEPVLDGVIVPVYVASYGSRD